MLYPPASNDIVALLREVIAEGFRRLIPWLYSGGPTPGFRPFSGAPGPTQRNAGCLGCGG